MYLVPLTVAELRPELMVAGGFQAVLELSKRQQARFILFIWFGGLLTWPNYYYDDDVCKV